jgi:hypothetical protein
MRGDRRVGFSPRGSLDPQKKLGSAEALRGLKSTLHGEYRHA